MTLEDRCRAIELLVLDVDGVLTDGGIIYEDPVVELKQFHVRDGAGIKFWHQVGKGTAIITGRISRIVQGRALELGIAYLAQGAEDKLAVFHAVLAGIKVRPEQVCMVGDDLPDLPVLRNCGLACAVADACVEVRATAHYVTSLPGGRGAVREVIERILRCQGLWQSVLAQFAGTSI